MKRRGEGGGSSAEESLDGMRVVRAGAGAAYQRPTTRIREFVRADETGGRWGLGEITADPDDAVVTHVHPDEPEAFVILEGAVELHGAQGTTQLHPGDVVFIPPDTEHGLRTPHGGRWLAVWPPSLDGLLQKLDDTTDPALVARLRQEHGMIPGPRYQRGRKQP